MSHRFSQANSKQVGRCTNNKAVARQDVAWQARVTVATVVEKNGRYLCVEEFSDPKNPDRLLINQPAGHVEPYEKLIAAAERETLEETGWVVRVTHFLGVYSYQPKPNLTYYRFCFLADALSHDAARPLDKGILKTSWYTQAELSNKSNLRSPMVLACVTDAGDGKCFALDIIDERILPHPDSF